MYNAAVAHDFEALEPLRQRILQISASIYTVGRYGSSYLKGVKCALSLMGICSDYIADPFHRFRQEERDRVKKALEELGFSF
jgi:dihydrodipicolinate synthase/N-acetylneuraminate lyase